MSWSEWDFVLIKTWAYPVTKEHKAVVCNQIQELGYLFPKDLLMIIILGLPREKQHISSNDLISHLLIVMLLITLCWKNSPKRRPFSLLRKTRNKQVSDSFIFGVYLCIFFCKNGAAQNKTTHLSSFTEYYTDISHASNQSFQSVWNHLWGSCSYANWTI